jgi:acyl transferase domain-containing protein
MNAREFFPAGAVAVIGISCRLPAAPDHGALWELLSSGRSAITAPPPGRPAGAVGGFVADVDRFDPEFFGISPNEARAMDPQQRLMLELAWEALEHARVLPAALAGTATGVFTGAIASDYAALTGQAGAEALSRHTMPGLNRGLIANRVSYALGLRGPSLTVDSAQSSSLMAVHLAVESLRGGESALALAGGVHLNLAPGGGEQAERFGGLSPDGRCYTFDARANGYVRGEGGGLVVLKPLERAKADGDRILAVILGSAAGHDGRTDGLTVPSASAQAEVIEAARRRAGLEPDAVQYVELHGTGTRVGDPVEAEALGRALGEGRVSGEGRVEALAVGSVKTNLGHLEGAAGIAGLLKAVLSVHHRRLPASLNHERPHPGIPLDRLGLRVQTALGPWPSPDRPLVAGVSAFGMGGANCHVILSEAPARHPDPRLPAPAPGAGVVGWVLSGHTPEALREQAHRLGAVLGDGCHDPADVARSLAAKTAFKHRAVIVGDGREALDGLRALSLGEPAPALVQGTAGPPGGTVFVFPGQGGQWQGMAAELLRTSPGFAAHVEDCAAALAPYLDWSLLDLLADRPGTPPLERPDVVQPALFAVMVALAGLWREAGVRPDAVIGHSQGEIAAAHVAGALTLQDAAAIVALRSRAVATVEGGAMGAIAAPAHEVLERLSPWSDRLSVAAVNGPAATVVSGESGALAALLSVYMAEGVRVREIPVGYASHSPQVEPLRQRILDDLSGIRPRSAATTFYSTVTGTPLDTSALTAEYWYRNLRQTVDLRRAVAASASDGNRLFVEVSPHPLLLDGITRSVPGVRAVGTLRRGQGGLRRFLTSLGTVQVSGSSPRWPALTAPDANLVDLPTYAFQRRRLWLPTPPTPATTEVPVASNGGAAVSQGPSAVGGAVAGSGTGLDQVKAALAAVLGYADGEEIDESRAFGDLGLDSAGSVEFRDRLSALSGRELPASLVYDHPTPQAVADLLTSSHRPRPESGRVRAGEPIAVVSMSGRWPGGARTPEELWDLLLSGRDAAGPFPGNRGWDLARLRSGGSVTQEGGFLYDADRFDAAFFGLSPREAAAMDPQQRLLLESVWELCERAGIKPATLRGSRTGTFVGITPSEYGPRLHEAPEAYEGQVLTGALPSVASGRIAYTLGLEGPAITVDTACSSSLVAIHLAVRSLREGECEQAVAGGAAVMAAPGMFTEFSRQGGLAPDGRCKPFSAAADGTAWSEAVGLVLLMPLSAALRAGRPVLALIRGSAVNQDGASNGLTAPNGLAQERVIAGALADAGLSAADIDAVEAHGTGTTLGDPVEARALLSVYGRDRERPFLLGSTKSHLGHTQAAAGVTGVIAMISALRAGRLPATRHLERPTPHVDWAAGAVHLLTEPTSWPRVERPRRAAVSSFGISGTNAHLILEAPPEQEGGQAVGEPGVRPWVVSAATPEALRELAARLRTRAADPAADPRDLAHTLATARADLEYRAVVLGEDRDTLLSGLDGLSTPAATGFVPVVTGRAGRPGKTAVLFSGQGSQQAGMGGRLSERFPVFADALAEVAHHLDPHLEHGVRAAMDDANLLDTTAYAQPAIFAYEVALFRLAEAFGVRASCLIGHSVGELAAAHVSGVLSLPDACALVAARGRLMQAVAAQGAMYALDANEREAGELIAGHLSDVDVAAVNAPRAVVISGTATVAEALAGRWRASGGRARRLAVSHAFHSPHMDTVLDDFHRVAAALHYADPVIPVVSNVTGRLAAAGELRDPAYWTRHVRRPVRFMDGVATLRGLGVRDYLELGPSAVLTPLLLACLDDDPPRTAAASAHRDRPEPWSFLTALAELYTGGAEIDWRPAADGRLTDLPTYPFQRERHWLDAPRTAAAPEADTWTHQVVWRPLRHRLAAPLRGTWVLVQPEDSSWAAPAAQALRARGADVLHLTHEVAGSGREVDGGASHGRSERDGLAARLSALSGIAGVVSLLAEHTAGGAHDALRATVGLTQALEDGGLAAPLWCVTRAAVSTGPHDHPPVPEQAQVWGFGAVAAVECPAVWGGLVDLPAEAALPPRTSRPDGGGRDAEGADRGAGGPADEWLWARVADALGGDEQELAVRESGPHARRLIRADPPSRPRGLRVDGTVLVTGGTGALGGHVATWFAEQGAEHLLLVSRSGENAPGAAALRERLAERGAEVTFAAADVGDRQALAEVIAGVPERHPLTAVVHAAAGLDDALVTSLTPERLIRAARAKADGARHLHELTAGHDLRAFVLFSSVAGLCGVPGQGNYTPGNAYLDALAAHRHALGLPATSVAWGTWAGDGLMNEAASATLARHGLRPMPPERAVAALGRALERGEPYVVVADADWEAMAGRPLLRELTSAAPPQDRPLDGLTDGERRHTLLHLVRSHTASVLGRRTPEEVEPDRSFKDQGFDSLASVRLRNQLGTATGLRLPPSAVFDHPTPEALAEHLHRALEPNPVTIDTVLAGIAALEDLLATVTATGAERDAASARLTRLALSWGPDLPDDSPPPEDDEALLAFVTRALGTP